MKLKKFALNGVAGLLVVAGLLYAGDYLSLRLRIPGNRPQFSQIQVQPYYAIAEKNNKTEFLSADPQLVTCSHSIFPQMGYSPVGMFNEISIKESTSKQRTISRVLRLSD